MRPMQDELPALKQDDSVLGGPPAAAGGGGGAAGESAPAAFSLPPLKLPKLPPK